MASNEDNVADQSIGKADDLASNHQPIETLVAAEDTFAAGGAGAPTKLLQSPGSAGSGEDFASAISQSLHVTPTRTGVEAQMPTDAVEKVEDGLEK